MTTGRGAIGKRSETSNSCNRDRLVISGAGALGKHPLNNSHQSLASFLRQHAEHATVLHGDRVRGAAGGRVPLSEARDAEERQHVRLGAGVNFRGASNKPSQGKRWCPLRPVISASHRTAHQTPLKNLAFFFFFFFFLNVLF